MLRTRLCSRHRHTPPTTLDPALKHLRKTLGIRSLTRQGLFKTREGESAGQFGHDPYNRPYPMMTHTDFGFFEHAADTHHAEMGAMLPRKGKGLPPWYRGADTYSPLYSEQARWEVHRHTMVARHPREYKHLFLFYLSRIRQPYHAPHYLPQQSLHWLLRMLVDNLPPQHIHYQSAMECLMHFGEYDMAVDVWRTMERQQTWPEDKLIGLYLQLCALVRGAGMALECWNRYASEKRFLETHEVDPKPVSRVPFALTREELFHLPKWKKHFEHDPNQDVVDLNRFNTTRNIYRWMCAALLSAGETKLMEGFLGELEEKLLETPTPVPEPPNPRMLPHRETWSPYLEQKHMENPTWRFEDGYTAGKGLGPQRPELRETHSRFLSNEQYLLRTYCTLLEMIYRHAPRKKDKEGRSKNSTLPVGNSTQFCEKGIERFAANIPDPYQFGVRLMQRCEKVLGEDRLRTLDLRRYLQTCLRHHRELGNVSATELHDIAHGLLRPRQESLHGAHYLELLLGIVNEAESQGPLEASACRELLQTLIRLLREMNTAPGMTWTLAHHMAVLRVLVGCRTGKANAYFVQNVLRKFKWTDEAIVVLYREYKLHPDVNSWAEHTKRALIWAARYNVRVSETTRRLIEEDYEVIGVQMRTTQELMTFAYRSKSEEKQRADPSAQLPNPVMDRVVHALPFPDRDTGFMNEYGELGQWRSPNVGTGAKGPGYWAPRMYGEHQQGYHAEWRDRSDPMCPVKLPSPFDRKYKAFARGKHPSYDMTYAGPHPEIFPDRHNWRRRTRWDFQDVHKQGKFRMHGPY